MVRLLDDPLLLALPACTRWRAASASTCATSRPRRGSVVQPEGPGVAHAACVAAGFEPAVHFDARTEDVALELVAAGLGVAFVSSLSVATEWPGAVLHDLDDRAPVRRVVAIARPEAYRPPAVAAMVELVREGSRRWPRSESDRAASS